MYGIAKLRNSLISRVEIHNLRSSYPWHSQITSGASQPRVRDPKYNTTKLRRGKQRGLQQIAGGKQQGRPNITKTTQSAPAPPNKKGESPTSGTSSTPTLNIRKPPTTAKSPKILKGQSLHPNQTRKGSDTASISREAFQSFRPICEPRRIDMKKGEKC